MSAADRQIGAAASMRRIGGMVRRHWYVIRSSPPRIVELIFWPMLSMTTWGLVQQHLAQTTSLATKAAGLFVGGILLWEMLVRGHLGLAVAFLEEIWSKNLGHLMMSPLRPWELAVSLMTVSLIKLLIAMVPVSIAAHVMFGFNVTALGAAFALFFVNLVVMGWALGLASTGAVLRWGLGAEALAWMLAFLVMPLACVFYPVATLPAWLQPVALALPATHVFEGLRALVYQQVIDRDALLHAALLNVVYIAASYALFRRLLESARDSGSLVGLGE